MATKNVNLRSLPAVPAPTVEIIHFPTTTRGRLDTEFKPVFDAAAAVLKNDATRATNENSDWRALADAFYERVLVPHYDIKERAIKRELQDYIAEVTGAPYTVSTQDRLGLAPVARFFFQAKGADVGRPAVSRLATLGWAAMKLNSKPSEAMKNPDNFDKGKGIDTINGFLANIRTDYGSEIDPERKGRADKAKLERSNKAVDALLANPTQKLVEVLDQTVEITGTKFDPETDKIIFAFGGRTDAARKMMADLLGIAEEDKTEHLIRIRRRNGTFEVTWCDVGQIPTPEQQREVDKEGEEQGGEGEEPESGE